MVWLSVSVMIGERPGGVALTDGLADGAILGVALADDVGEFGVAPDHTVDLLMPAARADGLGLFGVAEGADDRGPGSLQQAVHAWCMRGVSTIAASSTITTVREVGRMVPAWTAWVNASMV
jgi:hypothetical protein